MVYRKILNLALPAMGEQLLQMLMGAIDSYLVAQIGLAAVSGVSVANNVMSIYQAVFIGLATATSSLVARRQRSDHPALIGQSLGLTMMVGLIAGLVAVSLGGFIFSGLGLTGAVNQAAGSYFSLVGGGAVLLGLMTTLSGLLRVQGRPQLPLWVSFLANGLNLILSASFLYLTSLGLIGVALGTVLARLVGVCLLYHVLTDKPAWRQLWPKNQELISLSLPLIGERLMMRAGDVVVVAVVVSLGTAAVAGQAIGETLIQFSFMPALAFGTATVILVAKLSSDPQALRRLVRACYLLALAFMLVTSLVIWGFGDQWLSFFTSDGEVRALAKILLFFAVIDSPVTAGTQIYAATWQGLGQPKLPFYATSIGMWVGRVLGGYVLAVQLGLGLLGVCLAIALDNLWRTVFLSNRLKQYVTKSSF